MSNKNILLTPILIPTSDASVLHIFNGKLRSVSEYEKSFSKDYLAQAKAHHLYLTSDAPIKEGDWTIWHGKDNQPLLKKVIGKRAFADYNELLCSGVYDMWIEESKLKKISFTTDPKLIAEGVPAIDGDTKAVIEIGLKNFNDNDMVKEVNFLYEFCNRYNQKDNQKVDVEKFDFDEYIKLQGEGSEYNRMYGHHFKTFKAGRESIKSQVGCFSLEDMMQLSLYCFKSSEVPVEMYIENVKKFIQSLTKETPKGDIVIELNDGKLTFK